MQHHQCNHICKALKLHLEVYGLDAGPEPKLELELNTSRTPPAHSIPLPDELGSDMSLHTDREASFASQSCCVRVRESGELRCLSMSKLYPILKPRKNLKQLPPVHRNTSNSNTQLPLITSLLEENSQASQAKTGLDNF